MATASETIAILIKADGASAVRELEKVGAKAKTEMGKAEKATRDWSATFTRSGATMVGVAAVGAAGLYKMGDAASDLGESVNKSSVIFGDAAASVEAFAESAEDIGLSKRAALDAAAGFGTLFVGVGKSETEAAGFSKTLTGLAADLASFNNTSVDDAVLALGSGLRGEAEPLRRFGVLLDEATLKQKALDLGLVSTSTGTLPQAVKVQAAYAAILEQTTRQQGDFGRTSDSLANQQRTLSAEWENLQANIGKGVLPALTKLVGTGSDLIGMFGGLPAPVQSAAGGLATAGVAAAGLVGGLLLVAGQARKARDALTVVGADGGRSLTKLGRAGVGLAALVGTLTLLDEIGDSLGRSAPADVDRFTASVKRLAAGQGVAGVAAERFGSDLELIDDHLYSLGRRLDGAGRSAYNLGSLLADPFVDYGRTEINKAEQALSELDDTLSSLVKAGDAESAATAFEVFADKAADAGYSTQDLLKYLPSYAGLVKDAAEGTSDFGSAAGGAVGPTGDLAGETETAAAAYERYADAVHSAYENERDLRETRGDLLESQIAIRDAIRDVAARQEDLNIATRDFGKDSPEAKKAADELALAFLGVSDEIDGQTGLYVGLAQKLTGYKTDGENAKSVTDDYVAALGFLAGSLEPGSAVRTNIDGLAQDIRDANLAAENDAITRWALQGQGLPPGPDPTGPDPTLTQDEIDAIVEEENRPHRAIGGPVSAQRGYRVNEHGEEWFRPSVPGVIIPNHQLRTNTPAGGTQVVVNIHGDVNTEIDFERKVVSALASAGRRGG